MSLLAQRNHQEINDDSLNGGIAVLERLLEFQHSSVDPTAVRRAMTEAASAWPGDAANLWWKWLVEAGRGLGLELRVIDADPADLALMVSNRDCVATFVRGAEHPWRLARQRRRAELYRFGDLQASDPSEAVVVGPHRLSDELTGTRTSPANRHDPVRCVVSEPAMPVHSPHTKHGHEKQGQGEHHGAKPFDRLVSLLQPEWPDIWVVLVFALFVGLLALATPIAVEALVSTVAFGRFLQPVVVLAVMLFAFLTFGAAVRALQTFVAEIIQRRLFVRIAGELSRRLPRVRADALDGQNGPELVNRFFDVVTVQKVVANLLLDAVTIVMGTVVGMVVLAFYHPWLLGFDVVLLASIGIIIFGLGRGAVNSSIKESKRKYRMAAWLEELVRCPTAFRLGGGGQFAAERADLLAAQYLSDRQKHFRILFRQIVFALAFQAVASTVLLGLGGWLVIRGQLTLGQLVAAELIVAVIVGGFAKLGKHLESWYDLLAAVDKIGVLFDLPLERIDGILTTAGDGPATVSIVGAAFKHKPSGRGLTAIHAELQPGESAAIFGPSASGKSTLADLLFGLREPTAGRIELDGLDPRDLRPDILRQRVALVRGVEIFEGTIAENIHLERPGVTTADVRDALAVVGLLESILALPDALDTHLASGGDLFSESQAKRLMLARALAGRPRLLIVDGTLDSLPVGEIGDVIDTLSARDRTLMVMTARRDVAERCGRTIRIG